MLDALVTNLIESFADVIASTAMTMANDHQERRDKLAEYEAGVLHSARSLMTEIVAPLGQAVRNRYLDWLAHPRLGHEPPAAELRAADIGLNEAVVALKANPSWLNRALSIGASIRLGAITQVLGVSCIYCDASARPKPVAARRATQSIRRNDKRLKRRAPVLDDVPDALRPVVAQLGTKDPERAGAIERLEAERGGSLDENGIVTKLAVLAAHADHQEFVETLAAQAAEFTRRSEAAPVTPATPQPVQPAPTQTLAADNNTVGRPQPANVAVNRSGAEKDNMAGADIAKVAEFVKQNTWAIIERDGRYFLKTLKRSDINLAFRRVAAAPEMQEALRRAHAAGPEGPTK